MFQAGRAAVFLAFWLAAAHASAAELTGHVQDENEAPVAGAHVTVRAIAPLTGVWQADTDPTGAFYITLPASGDFSIDVEREGYYALKNHAAHVEPDLSVILTINSVREVFQSVDVSEQPSPVDISQTSNQETLTGTEINDIPYSNSHSLLNSMKLMPGVVEDPTGGVHFNGSSENQVQYLLNGFNITNPVSGQFNTTLAVEGIRSLDYSSGRYSPEYGKGTAGVVAISTENGTDTFHTTATDFIPGVDIRQGIRLGSWYPRFGVSGPIVRGRVWFSDTFDLEYNTGLVTGLPAGQNTRSGLAGNNLLHLQANLTPRNILFTDFLINIDNEGRVGLSPLDPVSTTQTVRTREYFGSLKDLIYIGNRSLIEFGYAHNDFVTSQTPQGQNLYVFSPQGRSGNYFITSSQDSSRDQATVHGYAPRFHFFGSHEIQAGIDADALNYTGDFHRTGYELLGLSGQLLSETTFTGSGMFRVHDSEFSSWLLDTWRIAKRFQVEAGVRQDWDQRVDAVGWSPRASFSWAPFSSGKTRIAGGYSVAFDAVPLSMFGQILDQSALTTSYSANGAPVGPPVFTAFAPGSSLQLPRAVNWSLSVDHQLSSRFYVTAKYLRRRETDGFNFVNVLDLYAPPSLLPIPSGSEAGIYELENSRRDNYDSVQLAVHQTFSGQHEWMLSYTRSAAQSNALLDVNAATPLQVLSSMVPVPWDSPNRLVGFAYLPMPPALGKRWMKNWSVAVLADARTGFPFSAEQQTGVVVGGADSHRYPFNFDLNLALERIVTLRQYRFALRGGVDNLTDSKNPTAVYNILGSPQYLQFVGDEGRHFVVRIRYFGRGTTK